ncbi:DMT family transporter [Mucilaginibacter achroorhodeus]|uniref:DMT family transporter n=1 Tax=Mucilaginibacter achroorhodeus TaxID=2599294 RepID=A0A563U5L4_9SPHI|nr:DMT family transporter [Mucilaginibacter achroorhodeus]TWR26637.1 DMT family transporter [Mucilaginibacter achroorhodeus]
MLYVFLSVCCSVIVSVLLKVARRYSIDVFQAITWNYGMAILLTWFFFKPNFGTFEIKQAPVSVYIAVGILLPLIFWIMAKSVRLAGIVRTDVAQRLSLFISLFAAFLLFGDQFNLARLACFSVGFAAILCSIPWQKQTANRKVLSNAWIYLICVFIGFGAIDILFKKVAASTAVPYTTSLFFIYALSFVIALISLAVKVISGKTRVHWAHIMFGLILGVANFGNILFYLKAHKALSTSPSLVFSAMNIGVISVGALVGLVVFHERLSKLNKLGLALAIISIIMITTVNIMHW